VRGSVKSKNAGILGGRRSFAGKVGKDWREIVGSVSSGAVVGEGESDIDRTVTDTSINRRDRG